MAVLKASDSRRGERRGIVLDLGDLREEAARLERSAVERSEAILREAREERARILAGAEEEGRRVGVEKGIEEGRAIGREEGRGEALEARREELDRMVEMWGVALDEVVSRRDAIVSDARRDVIGLALAIAGRVVRRCVELDPSVVVEQVGSAVELVMRRTRMEVSVHPEDRAVVEEAMPLLVRRLGESAHVEMVGDETVERGSCVVRTEHGEVDATIGGQLDRIAEALVGRGGVEG